MPHTDPLDEMVDGSGRTRPHWRTIVERAFTLGAETLRERARNLERAAVEEGVASLLAGADVNAWRCDPIPLPLTADEFAFLADGLAQRATVLDAMLHDLYGPQTLLDRGLLPPAMVFASRDFLRSGRGDDQADGQPRRRRLHLYAADLVRGPDGAWRVLADRCAKPGGIAAALENRRLLWRVMPELFREEIENLEPFFATWREVLRAASAEPQPGIALLTEGHLDPAWFEHVVLARELGIDLVQGNDLTLRSGTLLLKTLRGLKRIDVLLNRQQANLLDPLELEWHDSAGVPGLLSAWRGGRVAILNDPGAGLAEQPGLAAFLPGIADALIGERLLLASAETMWLGFRAARDRLRAEPDAWLVRNARDSEIPPVDPVKLSPVARARLAAGIDRDPARFAAVARIVGSVAPTVEPARLEPRRVVLRLFLLHDGQRWVPMRGGLARIVPGDDTIASALPSSGVAKDVFVLADRETGRARYWSQPPLPLARVQPLQIRRTEGDLPARVAEEFFQLGRQLELFETGARLARALATRLARYVHRPRELVELRVLAACLAPMKIVPPDRLIDPAAPGLAEALVRLAHAGSPLADQARAMFSQIGQLRDRMTTEMHFILTQSLGDLLGSFIGTTGVVGLAEGESTSPSLDDLAHVTGRMLGFAATLAGLVSETMVRGGGRLFLELGMRLTRAETVCTEMRACLGPAACLPPHAGLMSAGTTQRGPDLDVGLTLALELRDSAITYRGRYFGRLEAAPVLDLILADPANPRALGSQLDAVCNLLVRLGDIGGVELLERAEQLVADNRANVTSLLAEPDADDMAGRFVERLTTLESGLVGLRRAVGRRYIDLLPEMRTVR
jgi:uncharacterized circularly permuted ATP-grasp superfamily protein/uncharacterized alpha-E superfamily protein